jgi:hypothetical protein
MKDIPKDGQGEIHEQVRDNKGNLIGYKDTNSFGITTVRDKTGRAIGWSQKDATMAFGLRGRIAHGDHPDLLFNLAPEDRP